MTGVASGKLLPVYDYSEFVHNILKCDYLHDNIRYQVYFNLNVTQSILIQCISTKSISINT